ncbi:MAG: glycosyltransferase family 2 protein [Paracoccaceae bacterium]
MAGKPGKTAAVRRAETTGPGPGPVPGPERPLGASDVWGTVPFALRRHISPHGQLTAISMMKDEGPYVLEWVAHHLAVGFTDLVVYTNDCSDGTDEMLIRLEELGLCHHRRNVIPAGQRPQPSALNHAQDEPVVQQSDWVMVFDADEFLSIRHGDGSVDGLITAAKDQGASGIVVTWRIFGSAGAVDWSRAPVTEQFLMAAPPSWNKGWGVKTLFAYSPEHWKLGIHRPKMKSKWLKSDFPDRVKWLNGSGREMEDYFKFRGWRSIARTVGYDWVQLNHYAVKSVDAYAIRKLRGNVNNKADKYNSAYWSLQDRNEVRDETMLRYSAARGRIMEALLSDPVLRRLHFGALTRAEARLEELRQSEDYRQLRADLAAASQVPISQIVAKPPQPRDREKIAALMSEVEKARASKSRAQRKSAPAPAPAPAPAVPMGNYVAGPIDLSEERDLPVFANHTMRLPADERVFAAPALPALRAGKFERGLARKMPAVLPRGARVLEIGSATGFLAGHCANIRPDLSLTLQEDNPGLVRMMGRVCALSGRAFDDRFRLSGASLDGDSEKAALALIRAEAPRCLLIADGRLPVAALGRVLGRLGDDLPEQVFVYGRWMEAFHADLPALAEVLGACGFTPAFGFDPTICRAFARAAPSPGAGMADPGGG